MVYMYKQTIAEKIQQRILQMVVHSAIYYDLDDNIVSDATWAKWAKELVSLQDQYPDIAAKIIYADEFKGFDGSTGFSLPRDQKVMAKAKYLLSIKSRRN